MSDNWDKCFPVNAVYIKAVRWDQLPPEAQEDLPPGVSGQFIIFNYEGKVMALADSKSIAKRVAIKNNREIFTLH